MSRGHPRTKYLIVAGLCAALHYVVIVGLHALGAHYVVSSFISFGLTGVVGYVLHSRWTFPGPPMPHAFWRYLTGMAANLPLSILTLFLLRDAIGFSFQIAVPLSMSAMIVINFVLARWAIRGKRQATYHAA